jgi:tetratricopeptide (TPR) repeat protein
MSDACDDDGLRVFTRTYFGAMLAMAVRGWDEAATSLTEAILIADEAGLHAEGATAHGVVAGVHMMAGDYDRAAAHAQTGFELSDDPGARSVNLTFLAAVGADVGDVDEALVYGKEAVAAARTAGDPVRLLYACGHAGRVALMHADLDVARTLVTEACMIGAGTMLALQPWPTAMLAEVEIADGNFETAVVRARQAAALAATTEIVYQQALAHRALGLAAAATGDVDVAVGELQEALVLGRRTTGEGYLFHWPVAFILDSLSMVTATNDPSASHRWAATLEEHASVVGMHAMVERARERRGSLPAGP